MRRRPRAATTRRTWICSNWLVKMAELVGLCVEAHDAGTTTEDGSYSGGAIHRACAWLRDQKHNRAIRPRDPRARLMPAKHEKANK